MLSARVLSHTILTHLVADALHGVFSELEETPFCRRAFLVMDVDKRSGGANNLDFGEFLAGIYNYCSMSHLVCVLAIDVRLAKSM